MIQTSYIRKYRNSELVQFLTDVDLLMVNGPKPSNKFLKVLENLQQLTNEMASIFKQERGTAITQTLEAADVRRDRALVGLRYVLLGLTYHSDEVVMGKAKALLEIIERQGPGVARLNYQAETAVINKIITDLETDAELVTYITELNIQYWTTELKTANTEFSNLYIKRTVEYGARFGQDRLPELREEAIVAYRDFIKFLTALATLNEEVYAVLLAQLNALIKQYNTLVLERIGTSTEVPDDLEDIDELPETDVVADTLNTE